MPIITCGCPDGWSSWKHKCYWNGQRSNFETNKQVCEEKNAELVSIESAEENSAILRYLNSRGRGDHWLSAKRVEVGVNKFKWGDGTDFTFTNWWPGEPSELHKLNAGCVIIGSDGRWWDVPCNDIRTQLCQIELNKPPAKFNFTSYMLNNTADLNTRIDNNTYVIEALKSHIRSLSKVIIKS
ncbi:aggrecan core protein-like protein [Leptotrombidium deliense]|uniref:Aggrecan core protein-like protein n=1 Tax=Leptotrombidium deliense TaxID=299467 RepID=A0A443S1Y4_9ACAR|nr:aggrecan core protein-like protein [Leptotrombidium deliense]